MKKFIAGVVLTVVAFMALTTGALASNGNGRNSYKSTDTSQSKEYKGNSTCSYYDGTDYDCYA